MGAALGAVGTGVQAFGQIQSGYAAANAAKYNAMIQEQNADISTQNASYAGIKGDIDAAASQQKTKADLGSIVTNQGASGVDVASSSSSNVRASAAQVGMLDAMTIRSNAARTAYGYQLEALGHKEQAELDKQESKQDKKAAILGATSTVLGSAAKGNQSGMFDQYQSSKGL